jgi:hypothetical protein
MVSAWLNRNRAYAGVVEAPQPAGDEDVDLFNDKAQLDCEFSLLEAKNAEDDDIGCGTPVDELEGVEGL